MPLRIVIEETAPGQFQVQAPEAPCAHTHPPEVPTGPCKMQVTSDEARRIGNQLGVDFNVIELSQFAEGLRVEQEHADVTGGSLLTTGKIAHAHLLEDKDYYRKLKKVEGKSPSTSSEELAHAGRSSEEMPTGIRIDSAKDVYLHHYDDFSKRTQEVFVVGCLSVSGELIGKPYEVALGQRAEVGVEVVDIVRPVIQTNASGFYALHFHPSGHAKPSKADIELTEMISSHTKANLPSVAFVDHVVVGCFADGGGEYCSIHETKKIYDGKTHEVIGTVKGYAKGYSRGGPSQKAAQASAKAKAPRKSKSKKK